VSEIAETVQEAVESSHGGHHGPSHGTGLGSWVAILVALTAVMMGLCNIRSGKLVQAMDRVEAHEVDTWSYYQSKSTKQHISENMADLVEIQLLTAPAAARAALESSLKKYRGQAETYGVEKDSLQRAATALGRTYEQLDVHDDQFGMADASFSIAVALYGMTALTRRRWLLAFGIAATLVGAWSGLNGFMGWAFHPGWLSGWLG